MAFSTVIKTLNLCTTRRNFLKHFIVLLRVKVIRRVVCINFALVIVSAHDLVNEHFTLTFSCKIRDAVLFFFNFFKNFFFFLLESFGHFIRRFVSIGDQ